MSTTADTPKPSDKVMGTGTLEARVKTTISPRIQERLAEVLVDQGDHVKSGQLLRVAEADLKRSQAVIVEAQSQVFTAEKTCSRTSGTV